MIFEGLKYSTAYVGKFRKCAQAFKDHMSRSNILPTRGALLSWMEENRGAWSKEDRQAYGKLLAVLTHASESGSSLESLGKALDRSPSIERLSSWSRQLVDSFADGMNYGESHGKSARMHCSRFFLFMEQCGVMDPSGISPQLAKRFVLESANPSATSRNACNSSVRLMLGCFSERGLAPRQAWIAMGYANDIPMLDVLMPSEIDGAGFAGFRKPRGGPLEESAYSSAKSRHIELHAQLAYSGSVKMRNSRVLKWLDDFMEINGLPYSPEMGLAWLELLRGKCGFCRHKEAIAVVLGINSIMSSGALPAKALRRNGAKCELPAWSGNLLQKYVDLRKREDLSESAICMIKNSCSRFLGYLDSIGIEDASLVTPGVVRGFQIQDKHAAIEGKNAYTFRIRGFIRHLSEIGLAPCDLAMSFACDSAPRTKIVEALSEEQIDFLYEYGSKASSPEELRNSAMIMLGLKMGLRESDISNLKFTDISWSGSQISFIQQKTGEFLKLPLLVEAGNSMFRYIHEGRPPSPSPFVFISHRAPYQRLDPSAGNRAIGKALQGAGHAAGFHITRRTFASRMLGAGNRADAVAEALGHKNSSSLRKCIGVNERMLRKCAIGLDGIEYGGGFPQ
jgi:integrase